MQRGEMATHPGVSAQPTQPELEGRGTLGLLKRLMHELTTLFRQEVALGTAEVIGALKSLATSALSLAAGAALLFAGLLTLVAAAVLGLCNVVAPWLAAVIVGGVLTILGLLTSAAGGTSVRRTDLELRHSPESLRKDKEVLSRSRP